MEQEEKNCLQQIHTLGEQKSSDSVVVPYCPPPPVGPEDKLTEKSWQVDGAARNMNPTERKRCSEPLPGQGGFSNEGRKCFERRRLWTASKQESFDLPEEFKCPTEDNVFTEGERLRHGQRRLSQYRRSHSVPAMLPDIVPEQKSPAENSSPDLVSVGENPKPDLQSFKPALIVSSADTELMLEEKERKQNFEGAVHCDPASMPQEVKRKKSVTFETAVEIVRIMSARGKQARSHFRSSGYGSQSDSSQVSQGSNVSSERGSIFSDDVLQERRNSGANEGSQFAQPIPGTTTIHDNTGEERTDGKTQGKAASLHRENSQPGSSLDRSPHQTSKPQTPEEIDKTELWYRQNLPDFHYGNLDDIPNLSLFDMTKENSGTLYPSMHSENSLALQGAEKAPQTEAYQSQVPPPQQSPAKLPCVVEPSLNPKSPDGESSDNKSSPTTKEEWQRDLYKRLFEERMLQFDPSKESISDLFEWVKKNIGEALTPSPKSPFFSAEGSPHENLRISPDLVVAANTLQGMGLPGGAVGNLPAPSQHAIAGARHLAPNPLIPNQLNVPYAIFPGFRPTLAPSAGNQGVPLSQYPQQGLGTKLAPWMHAMQQPQCSRPPAGLRGGCDVGGGSGRTEWSANQANVDPPGRYQQDLPATLEDVMSSICISSSSEVSVSVGPSYMEHLVHISQCSSARCADTMCIQGKKSMQGLQDALKRGPGHLSAEDLNMLALLTEHYNTCELPNCPVPWCRYLSHLYPSKEEKTPPALIKVFSSPFLTLLPSECRFDLFVKLDSNFPRESMPREWEDWLMLYPLSSTYTVARVTPLLPVWPHRHWVVKVALLHEEGNQVEVYKKLRDLQHPHIVNHVWTAASYVSEILVVCTEFLPGVSMRDLLDQRSRLSCSQTCQYWQQILSAAQHLHDLGVVFLNWTCGNLLLDDRRQSVKLTNFIASVELSSGTADMGYIKLTLPADIVPTELLVQGGELTHRTDSWGLACLLHEMLTGTRPWHHLRHRRQEDTWLQIMKQVPPDLMSDLPSFGRHIIHHCLQKSPECRLSVKDMAECCRSQWF